VRFRWRWRIYLGAGGSGTVQAQGNNGGANQGTNALVVAGAVQVQWVQAQALPAGGAGGLVLHHQLLVHQHTTLAAVAVGKYWFSSRWWSWRWRCRWY
jgi:hypothetical protein